ncbi:hypothetical protein GJAV_G00191690 [Gymnothorax javanicus]|nr:hypothetical protein GJAV_G00191690 [Gymnothorax javanicus]
MRLFLLISLALGTLAMAANPAIKAIITNSGLKYGTLVGSEWLQERIMRAQIPDITGEISLSLLGIVQYTVSRITVTQVNLPLPEVVFSEGVGLQVDLRNLNVALKGKWNTRYYFIKDGGSFRLGLFNIDLSVLLQVSSDSQGRLSINSTRCSSRMGGMQLQFRGGTSWIWQLFVKAFERRIQSQVQKQICPVIELGIHGLEHRLATMNVTYQVGPSLLLDMPLMSSPVVKASDINLGFKGEFYNVHSRVEPPFVAGQFDLPEQSHLMLSLGVSEFSLNSAAFASKSAGQLQINITDKMIPQKFPIRLNTTSFGAFIPQLPKLFPDMQMLLQVYASDTPMVSFLPDNASVQLYGSAKAYAIKPDSSLAPLFRLDVSAKFSGKFFAMDAKLRGSIMLENLKLTLGASEVGRFQTQNLQATLTILVNMGVKKLNELLQVGIPIPAPKGMQWINTVLKVNKGFVAIGTDVTTTSVGDKEH